MTDHDIVEMVLRHEGVWDNNPADSGGKTAYGISSRYHPEAWVNGPPTREQAIAIYLKDYVAPFASVDPEHKPQVVDIAVNSGVTTARALYAVALANHGSRSVTTQLAIERLKHYARIVKSKPTNVVFLNGWIARACAFLTIWICCVAPLGADAGLNLKQSNAAHGTERYRCRVLFVGVLIANADQEAICSQARSPAKDTLLEPLQAFAPVTAYAGRRLLSRDDVAFWALRDSKVKVPRNAFPSTARAVRHRGSIARVAA